MSFTLAYKFNFLSNDLAWWLLWHSDTVNWATETSSGLYVIKPISSLVQLRNSYFFFFFFVDGVHLLQYCRANDTSPERTIIKAFPPAWVDPDVGRLYISISPLSLQSRGMWPTSKSSPMKLWLKRRLGADLLGIRSCQVTNETDFLE